MTKETWPFAKILFPIFSGIYFPRDYPAVIINDGHIFDIGRRKIETFKCFDNAVVMNCTCLFIYYDWKITR